jgi:molybdopterin synthase sulfur carrier subunit
MPIVKLFGGLRRHAGRVSVTIEGDTVRAALAALCAGNTKLRTAIWDGDKVRDHVRVMVGGHDIELGQGLDTPVTSNDEIAVFPPVAGGANKDSEKGTRCTVGLGRYSILI